MIGHKGQIMQIPLSNFVKTFNTKIYERKRKFINMFIVFIYVRFYVYFITYKILTQNIKG